jgi:hypothetical protein
MASIFAADASRLLIRKQGLFYPANKTRFSSDRFQDFRALLQRCSAFTVPYQVQYLSFPPVNICEKIFSVAASLLQTPDNGAVSSWHSLYCPNVCAQIASAIGVATTLLTTTPYFSTTPLHIYLSHFLSVTDTRSCRLLNFLYCE